MNKKMILMSAIASILLIGCGGSSDGDGKNGDKGNTPPPNPLKIYPTEAAVPSGGGNLKLVSIVQENGKILENSDDHVLYASYTSSDDDIFTVDNDGNVEGANPGEAILTVSIEDKNTTKTYTNKITIKVVTVDISKLFLNPSVASIAKGEKKTFTLTALDNDKSPTLLEASDINIKHQESLVSVSKKINANKSEVTVSAKENKGHVFITPEYKKAGITISGDPTLIQFSSTPQVTPPEDKDSGYELDFLRVKDKGGDNLYSVHTNESDKLYLDLFKHATGQWKRIDMEYEGEAISSPKVFFSGSVLHVLSVVDGYFHVFSSSNKGSSWVEESIQESVGPEVSSKTLDLVSLNGNQYMLTGDKNSLNLYRLSLEGDYEITKLVTHTTESGIVNVDLTKNADGDLRFVMTLKDGSIHYGTIDNITENSADGKLLKIKKVDGVMASKIAYSKYNTPSIVYQREGKLVELQLTNGGKWASSSISSLQFTENGFDGDSALENMEQFDFDVDKFGQSRIVVIDDNKLYYIKEYGKNNETSWRIDNIVTENVGENVSMEIDNKSRLKITYQDTETGWIKYFAEPVYIKYNDGKTKTKTDDSLQDSSKAINLWGKL